MESERNPDQPKESNPLRYFLERTGKLNEEDINLLWRLMDQNKEMHARVREIHQISQFDPKRAEIMLERLKDDLDKLREGH